MFEAAEIAKFTPDERDSYEARLKYYRDLKNVINTAIAEGKTGGRMIRLIEGKKKGKIEGKIEIARNAIAENIPMDIIIRLTGLAVEELGKLKNE